MATLANLITNLRILAKDTPTSKVVFGEMLGSGDTPSFPVDGVNTVFRLKKPALSDAAGAPTYTFFTIVGHGAVARSQSGLTITDPANGIITFSAAPNPGNGTYPVAPPSGVYVDYNWVWFMDSDYTEFLNLACEMVLAGVTDPTLVQSGLDTAMMQYALSQFWYARASQYAEQYRSAGGEASEDVQTVAQTYLALGKAANARGDYLKLDFYKRQGQREAPAFASPQQFPAPRFDKITPRH